MTSTIEVRTPAYQGPLDLLLGLISRKQLDVCEVSIAAIVDDFLAAVPALDHLSLEPATSFLLIAATLIQLKVTRLFPEEEEVELDDDLLAGAPDALLARLLAARTFREAGDLLRARLEEGARYFPRAAAGEEAFRAVAPDLLARVSPQDLARIAAEALEPRQEPRVDTDHVAPIRASVGDAISYLAEHLPRRGEVTFREVVQGTSRLVAIVRFLALLELAKEGLCELAQAGVFGTIRIRWAGDGDHTAAVAAAEEWDTVG